MITQPFEPLIYGLCSASVGYLYRNYHCKRKGVLKYLEFVLHQMHFAQKDEEYFQLMNEELEREVGVNVLGTSKGE